MTEFKGEVDIKDSTGVYTTLRLDGEKGWIILYDSESPAPQISISNTGRIILSGGSMGSDLVSLGGTSFYSSEKRSWRG